MKTSIVLLSLYSLLELSSAFVIPKKREEPSSLLRATISNKQASSFSKRDAGGIADLYSASPQEYAITINIGTPPQPIKVTLDTGSSDLVIPTTVCPKDHCSESALFDTSKSTTFSNFSTPMNLSYGIGNAIGYVGSETVLIGGISLVNQTVGFVTDLVDQTDGTFGLGYFANAETKGNPFPFQIYDAGIVVGGGFSIYFDKNASDPNNAGEIIFGGIDSTKFTGDLVSTPNAPRTTDNSASDYLYWDVIGQYMTISNANSLVSNTSFTNNTEGVFLLIDTGSSFSSLPQQFMDDIVGVFNATDISFNKDSGFYSVPCGASFYNDYIIEFGVGYSGSTIQLGIPLGDMIVETTDDTGVHECVIGASAGDIYILGLSVISNFYMVFDFIQHSISFAPSYLSQATVSA